jgi:hypothetical protein
MYIRAVRAAFDVYMHMGYPMQPAGPLPTKSGALMGADDVERRHHHAAWKEPDEPPLPV